MKKHTLWIVILAALIAAGLTASCRKGEDSLPDLAVADVTCQGGNLYVTVENRGDAALPEGWVAFASLTIDGTAQTDILLNEPTLVRDGGIAEPGGSSGYLLAFDLARAARIDVFLDTNDEIEESDEENNRMDSVYLGPCLLPDLEVKDIRLNDDSEVVVVVENVGPGAFPEVAWYGDGQLDCTLRVSLNDEERWLRTLIEFDPEKALQPFTGIVVLPTGLKITDEAVVTAAVDCPDIIKEQNEENNVKSVVLK